MAGVTTHVLDTAHGRPAAGVTVRLYALANGGARRLVAEAVTNADGRTDAPLLDPKGARAGTYEIEFEVGTYFAGIGEGDGEDAPTFLDIVPVRFAIARPDEHYHVPLLVGPWSYTTYRGS